MNNKIQLRLGIISIIVLAAALSRLLPHPYNFTPIGAMGLFGAAHLSRKYLAFLVPFLAMWISDLLLNNLVYARLYPDFYGDSFVWFGNLWVYASFAIIVGLGIVLLRRVKVSSLLAASLLASVLFFMVTNFGAWMADPRYPKTVAGLMAAYGAGIPFFWNTLLGDLFYVGVLFGAYEWVQRRFTVLSQERI